MSPQKSPTGQTSDTAVKYHYFWRCLILRTLYIKHYNHRIHAWGGWLGMTIPHPISSFTYSMVHPGLEIIPCLMIRRSINWSFVTFNILQNHMKQENWHCLRTLSLSERRLPLLPGQSMTRVSLGNGHQLYGPPSKSDPLSWTRGHFTD